MTTIPRSTCLYRIYDGDDLLLYIGISHTALYRLETHFADKSWAGEVRRVDVEWHETREAASAAEVAAIKAERPLHNVLHNGGKCRHEWLDITDKPKTRTRSLWDLAHVSRVRRPLIGRERYECRGCGKQLKELPR